MSSFQLQYIETFRPFVSLILNVTADHVDYHGTFEAYRRAKERIFENQKEGDRVVLNADDPYLSPPLTTPAAAVLKFSTMGEPEEGVFLRRDRMLLRTGGAEEDYPLDMIRIPGRHNVENVMAAVLGPGCRLFPGGDHRSGRNVPGHLSPDRARRREERGFLLRRLERDQYGGGAAGPGDLLPAGDPPHGGTRQGRGFRQPGRDGAGAGKAPHSLWRGGGADRWISRRDRPRGECGSPGACRPAGL